MAESKDWYSALGAKKPESAATDTGANAQDTAQPATDTGVPAQDVAQPATRTDTAEADTEETENPEADVVNIEAEKETPAAMSKEERAEQARRRREAETKSKIDAAIADAKKEFDAALQKAKDDTIAELHLRNPVTQKPITTLREYDDYMRDLNAKRINSGLSNAGIDRETIEAVINEHPDVVRARQLTQEVITEKTRVLDGEAAQTLEKRLEEIRKYDPAIKSENDLLALPEYPEIKKLVQKGLTIVEAYINVNHAAIIAKERNAARQAALNEVNGKNHLRTDVQRGTGGEPVPAGINKGYDILYGDKLRGADRQKKYEKTISSIKKG